jgi:hypothetical protein
VTKGRRCWLFALGVAAIVLLLSLGGVALAGSLLSSPRAPLFEKGGPVAGAHYGVKRAHFFDRTKSHTPADDQYGNPLEGKLCAVPSDIHFDFPPNLNPTSEIENGVAIHNCGDVPVTISAPRKGDPSSPFRPIVEYFDNAPECPVVSGTWTLNPGALCVLEIVFPGVPWPPPGDYSDTWTFAGDNASVTVHLFGTLPTK